MMGARDAASHNGTVRVETQRQQRGRKHETRQHVWDKASRSRVRDRTVGLQASRLERAFLDRRDRSNHRTVKKISRPNTATAAATPKARTRHAKRPSEHQRNSQTRSRRQCHSYRTLHIQPALESGKKLAASSLSALNFKDFAKIF